MGVCGCWGGVGGKKSWRRFRNWQSLIALAVAKACWFIHSLKLEN